MTGERRPLSNVGGPAAVRGAPLWSRVLAGAMTTPEDAELAREHVHGFHSYPARLHPQLARHLIEALSPADGSVLDPFAGSGTVLVEARLLGRRATSVDVNPLAVRLASLKSYGRNEIVRTRLVEGAIAAAEVANARRTTRAGASRRYPAADVAAFAPHVLLELDGLRVGIEGVSDLQVRADLGMVLSSLLTKLSRRGGDSSEEVVEKRIAAGFPARIFVAKAEELATRLADYESRLPERALPVRMIEADARDLRSIQGIDLVVTSPPYPGNYDYAEQHATRLRWLGLPSRSFEENEIGARRQLESESPESAERRWIDDLTLSLSSMKRTLSRGGGIVLVLADSVVSGRPFFNDDLTERAARRAGLQVAAIASQARPHFHGPSKNAFLRRPRQEHAILLRP